MKRPLNSACRSHKQLSEGRGDFRTHASVWCVRVCIGVCVVCMCVRACVCTHSYLSECVCSLCVQLFSVVALLVHSYVALVMYVSEELTALAPDLMSMFCGGALSASQLLTC